MIKYLNNMSALGLMFTLVGFIVVFTLLKWVAVGILVFTLIVLGAKYFDKIKGLIGLFDKHTPDKPSNP